MTTTASMSGSPGARVDASARKQSRDAEASGFDAMLASQGLPHEPKSAAPAAGTAQGAAPQDGNGRPAEQSGEQGGKPAGAAVEIGRALLARLNERAAAQAGNASPSDGAKAGARAGLLAGQGEQATAAPQGAGTYVPQAPESAEPPPEADADAAPAAPRTLPAGGFSGGAIPLGAAAVDAPTLRMALESALNGADAASRSEAGAQTELDASLDEASPQERLVTRQVGAHLLKNLGALNGKGSLRLTLNPEQLGRVEITFERDGADLKLTFRADGAAATQALREGAGDLQGTLLERGGQWDKVSVKVESDGEESPDEQDDTPDRREERGQHGEEEGSPS